MAKPKPKTKEVPDAIGNPALAEIELAKVESNPWQPRTSAPTDEELAELLDSIKAVGQKMPILVRPHSSKAGRFQLGDGAMRLLVKRKLGARTITAMVQPLSDRQMKILAIAANTFIRMRDTDKRTSVFKLWESEFKTEEPSAKGGRRDPEFTGIEQMHRETGISADQIRVYLIAYMAEQALTREAPKEVKAAFKEVSNYDMAAIAPIAKEAPKLAQEIVVARSDDELRSKDVQALAQTFRKATPAEKAKITEKAIAEKREERKAIQEVRKAADERIAKIAEETVSPEERAKTAERQRADADERQHEEEERLRREAAITKEREDSKQLQEFIQLEVAARNWLMRAEANTNDAVFGRIANVRNPNVKRETIAKVRSIADVVSQAAKVLSDFAARFKE